MSWSCLLGAIAWAAVLIAPAWGQDLPAQLAPVPGELALQSGRPALDLELVRTRWYDLWLARLLLPPAMLRADWTVPIMLPDRQGAPPKGGPFGDLAVDCLVRGRASGIYLSCAQGPEAPPGSPPALRVREARVSETGLFARLDVTIDPLQLPPDQYLGDLLIRSPRLAAGVLKVPVDLKVRQGPLLPVLVIFAGIVVGRLVQQLNAPGVQLQIRQMTRLSMLRSGIHVIIDARASRYLGRRIETLRMRIEAATEPEEALAGEFVAIEEQVRSLYALQELQRDVATVSDPPLREELYALVRAARDGVISGEADAVAQAIREIEQKLAGAGTAPAPLMAPVVLRAIKEHAAAVAPPADPAIAAQVPQTADSRSARLLGRLADVLASLAGVRPISAELWWRVLQPVLFLVVLVVLVLAGLKALYVDSTGGATFGALGIYDYLGLFLWGLGAEVAQKSLQQLKLPTAP